MPNLPSLIRILGHFFAQTLGVRFLLALAISLVLWSVFTSEQNPIREDFFNAEIPVETSRLGDGLVVSRTTPGTARLQIAAPRDIWDSLDADNFRVVVDLFAVGVGLHELPLETEGSDSRVRIIAAEPATVTVALEERREKEVPVRAELAGAVPSGYRYMAPEMLPGIVTVFGPASKVELVDTAWVDVEIGGARSTVNLTQRAMPRDAQGQDVSGVQLDPAVVQVTVPVEQVTSYKDVPVRIRIAGRPAAGYTVAGYAASLPTVTLVGAPPQLSAIEFVFTEPVNVAGATASFTRTVELERPEGIGISVSDQVEVTVEIVPIISSAETRVVVTHVNLQPGLQVEIEPNTVSVQLSGPAPVLGALQAGSVIVSLNLSGVSEGTYALMPDVSRPPQVNVESIDPPRLRVIVTGQPTPVPTPTPETVPTTPVPTPAATPTP